jgi:hypothetical protein
MIEWREEHKKRLLEGNLIKNMSSDNYSKISYILPVPKETIISIVSSSITHIGNLGNAIDFLVPEGTDVYAAADGTVTAVKDDSYIGGPDPKYWYKGNYIVIKHNGESTAYEHFRYQGIVVKARALWNFLDQEKRTMSHSKPNLKIFTTYMKQ